MSMSMTARGMGDGFDRIHRIIIPQKWGSGSFGGVFWLRLESG